MGLIDTDLNDRTHMNHGGQSWLKELQQMACESALIRQIRPIGVHLRSIAPIWLNNYENLELLNDKLICH